MKKATLLLVLLIGCLENGLAQTKKQFDIDLYLKQNNGKSSQLFLPLDSANQPLHFKDYGKSRKSVIDPEITHNMPCLKPKGNNFSMPVHKPDTSIFYTLRVKKD